jgi:hypothetical protein
MPLSGDLRYICSELADILDNLHLAWRTATGSPFGRSSSQIPATVLGGYSDDVNEVMRLIRQAESESARLAERIAAEEERARAQSQPVAAAPQPRTSPAPTLNDLLASVRSQPRGYALPDPPLRRVTDFNTT